MLCCCVSLSVIACKSFLQAVAVTRWLFQKCHMVHGDLSEYNLLYVHPKCLFVIDVGQAVERDHPQALDFLKRDCRNLTAFFRQQLSQAAKRLYLQQHVQGQQQGKQHLWRGVAQQQQDEEQQQQEQQQQQVQHEQQQQIEQHEMQQQQRVLQQQQVGQHGVLQQQQEEGEELSEKEKHQEKQWPMQSMRTRQAMPKELQQHEADVFTVANDGERKTVSNTVSEKEYERCACIYNRSLRGLFEQTPQQQLQLQLQQGRYDEGALQLQHQQTAQPKEQQASVGQQQQQQQHCLPNVDIAAYMHRDWIFAWPSYNSYNNNNTHSSGCTCRWRGVQPHTPYPLRFPPVSPEVSDESTYICMKREAETYVCARNNSSSSNSKALLTATYTTAISPWAARELFHFVVDPSLPVAIESILLDLQKAKTQQQQQEPQQEDHTVSAKTPPLCCEKGKCTYTGTSKDGSSSPSPNSRYCCCCCSNEGGALFSQSRALSSRGRKKKEKATTAAAPPLAEAEKSRLESQQQLKFLAEALGIYFIQQHESDAAGAVSEHAAEHNATAAAAATDKVRSHVDKAEEDNAQCMQRIDGGDLPTGYRVDSKAKERVASNRREAAVHDKGESIALQGRESLASDRRGSVASTGRENITTTERGSNTRDRNDTNGKDTRIARTRRDSIISDRRNSFASSRKEDTASEDDSAVDDEVFMRSWIPTRLSQLCPLQLLSKIPQQANAFQQEQQQENSDRWKDTVGKAKTSCGSRNGITKNHGTAEGKRKGREDAVDRLLALHALMQGREASVVWQQEKEEEEERDDTREKGKRNENLEEKYGEEREREGGGAHCWGVREFSGSVQYAQSECKAQVRCAAGQREESSFKKEKQEEEGEEEEEEEVEKEEESDKLESLENSEKAQRCDRRVVTSCSEFDDSLSGETNGEEVGKRERERNIGEEAKEGGEKEEGEEEGEEEEEEVYVFRGHIPEGVTRKEWKHLVKEQNRERRKYKVPKQLKKKYRSKAANR